MVGQMAQLVLHVAPLGDVDEVGQEANPVTAGVLQNRGGARGPYGLAVGSQQAEVTGIAGALAARQLAPQHEQLGELLGMADIGDAQRLQILARVAEQLAENRVDLEEVSGQSVTHMLTGASSKTLRNSSRASCTPRSAARSSVMSWTVPT